VSDLVTDSHCDPSHLNQSINCCEIFSVLTFSQDIHAPYSLPLQGARDNLNVHSLQKRLSPSVEIHQKLFHLNNIPSNRQASLGCAPGSPRTQNLEHVQYNNRHLPLPTQKASHPPLRKIGRRHKDNHSMGIFGPSVSHPLHGCQFQSYSEMPGRRARDQGCAVAR
jgi:hypothetical protein